MTEAHKKVVPQHVVIIPDGNRRWAQKHGLEPIEGHKKGLEVAFNIVKASKNIGVKVLTLWSFSTENWKRPSQEVKYLMHIYRIFFKKHVKELIKEGVRFKWLGRRDRVPQSLKKLLLAIEKQTAKNKNYILNICLDYGGRDELVRAFRKIVRRGVKSSQIDEDLISKNLDTAGLPEPDLLIRTSGEKRTSGMMPWQTAYTEYYFSKLYFPDFSKEELKRAISDYSSRRRRYGS
ncbi:di-trans,poly-cis-decaprenylcistransferase [Candidatus Curtissbacteria bacterium RIFCSPHIGHO2_02_FULL_40_17]|uniref:Isoprenyl transferase n=4 Tax=Candidatus Curtissiibacteriota TaxID=1752717 RepID=A0A1F5GIW8_9BACT|nr:MAG: di-trans,poly-cis-decaprenylcistransferase [Candidatus Curtissbacteria bacterium RIFCSPHIGHO2_02_FULL_40_17]OGE05778.1 MAG: di-trans,poly-cis-decaprenylcistransferase [Candidatus Curtissbacteria bacterium RIFCSPHIGHO2_12_FULL_41_17]OGE08298.1 MAG: di-trans,poly-cis-decaprenylcistransferase [Candidatus Curtissbacteria bacterium RIFCSPLOWO2_02_FULL_40_13b]